MASIRQREGKWQARISIKDYPPVAKTFSNKADAVAWAKITESEMIRGAFIKRTDAERTTLREALDRYQREITVKKRGFKTEHLRIEKWKETRLALRSLASLRPTDFAKYRDQRIESGMAPSTVRLELAIISHLFNVAKKEWGYEGTANPIESIRMPSANNARSRLFQPGEEFYLFKALSPGKRGAKGIENAGCNAPWLKPLVQLALETGMRRGELLSLKWEHIDFETQVAFLAITKNSRPRSVPLSTSALAVLIRLGTNTNGVVFPVTENAVKLSFTRAVRRARRLYEADCVMLQRETDPRMLQDLHFHDLRHVAITNLAEKLPNIVELAAVSGHSDVRMLKRYYHPKAEALARKLG